MVLIPALQPPAILHAQVQDMLNAPSSVSFDRITRLASRALQKPFAAVSLTDTTCQWLRSRIGAIPLMVPSYDAPCTRVSETRKPLAVPDLLAHPTYRNGLLAAHGVRFYAGAPLVMPDGSAVGASASWARTCTSRPRRRWRCCRIRPPW